MPKHSPDVLKKKKIRRDFSEIDRPSPWISSEMVAIAAGKAVVVAGMVVVVRRVKRKTFVCFII